MGSDTMRKKYLKNIHQLNSFKIVPKEYIGYILLVGVLCVALLPGSIFTAITFIQRHDEFQFFEGFIIMILPLCGLSMTTYILISIIKICTGRIHLKVTEGVLKYNGVLYKKYMNISDIKTVKNESGGRGLNRILIIRKIDKSSIQSKRIRFPLIWFSDRDIEYFLEYLNKTNKHIEWVDF